ncbi:hypothetical protein VNO77_10249 [Canavalia gladiata]|uniref:Protein kinase domain-containing protein n=1 Tax=Canavalia gladiata TaxID=3824 RepID=A0AAN9QX07_CANGL
MAMGMYSKQVLQLVVVATLFGATQTLPKPNCPTKCGSVNIPFPFGMSKECSLDSSFIITCNQTSHTPFLKNNRNLAVLNISLDGQLQISSPVATTCYDNNTAEWVNQTNWVFYIAPFRLSPTGNKLTAVGVDTAGLLAPSTHSFEGYNYTATMCLSAVYSPDLVKNGSCSGVGCCEAPIQQGLSNFYYLSSNNIINNSYYNTLLGSSPCSYAFLVEDGAYNFSSTHLLNFNTTAFPIVLDWAVGNRTCQQALKNSSSYACKSDNSICRNSKVGPGYLCKCSPGFLGNPYLPHPHPHGCQGVSVSMLALLGGSFYVYWALKKRRLIKLKEQFFKQNGGILLQQQIASHRGSTEMIKVLTVEELKKATNNFNKDRILGQGGQGTVYKGVLLDNRTVAIKKSKISEPNQVEQFINEMIVLSQINHRNVVKLLGCCLETKVPMLLHSAASEPIIHRDVKTSNILLDQNLTAKVSDFGASRIVPLDQTQLTTLVQGTLGYLDPEYLHTSQLTEKSDVYSFGVVLAELLTGKKALSFYKQEESVTNLAVYFISSMKEGRLLDIVDNHIKDEANVEQLMEFANITKRCLKVKGEERPSMKEVEMELERLRFAEMHQQEGANC